MRIGTFNLSRTGDLGLEQLIAGAQKAADDGLDSYWLPQIFGPDALTMLALVGREVDRIELGTAVVPIYGRHPMPLAQHALTVNAACGGRLTLGLGLSHQIVVEQMWGLPFDRPARRMREFLSALCPLIREGTVAFEGKTVTARGAVEVAGAEPCQVLVAALGPRMLQIAGELAEGTITWMTGAKTLAAHTVPGITAAAREAGREAPRVVASLPVCVTDDADDARARAAKAFRVYGDLPSYRAMLDREGAQGPADVAILGDEATVRAELDQLAEAGVTDFVAAEFSREDVERGRTRELLVSLS